MMTVISASSLTVALRSYKMYDCSCLRDVPAYRADLPVMSWRDEPFMRIGEQNYADIGSNRQGIP
jgi:hypothetical protein